MKLVLQVCGVCGSASYDSEFLLGMYRNWSGAEYELCKGCESLLWTRNDMYSLPAIVQERK